MMIELIDQVWHCQDMAAAPEPDAPLASSQRQPDARLASRQPVAPLAGSHRPARDAPVRQRSLRTHNLGLVLRHVATSSRPVSRADVAAATGLTKATVSTLVDELLAGSLLAEVDPAPRTGAGRPAVGLRLASQGPAGLGLEINIDYLAACVVDLTGRERHRELLRGDLRGRTPEAILDDLADLARTAMAAAKTEDLVVAGVALAAPGLIADGVVRLAPNLDWRDLHVRSLLIARGLPEDLTVDNEANLAAIGELHARADIDPAAARASFLYISGEIGVGAGIVLGGELYRGARGFGGELGHVTIRPDGTLCRCGARGCLEAYANQEALLRYAGLTESAPATALGDGSPDAFAGSSLAGSSLAGSSLAGSSDRGTGTALADGGVARLAALARAGAHPALMALEQAGSALGVATADVVNLLDVDMIVLGGIYAPLAPWLVEPIQREINERVMAAAWAPVTVEASLLGASATVVGAAGSVVRSIRDAPATWLESQTA
jgi:predicted NBD/HSP70 family sugar kinase